MLHAAVVALLLVVLLAPNAAGQAPVPDPTGYCEGGGGLLGAATDREHSVLLGEAPLPAGLRSRRVRVAGVSTRVVEGGPARAADAVVFVHGHPGSARDFDGLVAAGGRFARTVSFDISGFGKSDHFARHVQSTDGAAGYIGGLLRELGIRRAVLVVHDLGGPWALQWAARHPDALTGAVLMNSGVFIDYFPHALVFVWGTPGAGELNMASTTRASFRATFQSVFRGLPPDHVDRLYDDYDRPTRCAVLRYYRSLFWQGGPSLGAQQAAVLRKRRRPALVIWGKKDPVIPPEQAEKQREAFPNARIHMFEDSGHWPFIDSAARARALFVSFLRPALRVRRPRARAGRRRLRVRLRVAGFLPAYGVRARLGHKGSSRRRTVISRRTLVVRLRRPLRPGRHVLKVTARGLPTQRVAFRAKRKRAGGG